MVTGRKNVFNCAANFLRGRKCVFCGSFQPCKTRRGYAKRGRKICGKQKSLKQLRKEIAIITGFYQQQPAYRVATDLGRVYAKVVERVTADELMAHIRQHTRKGSVYYTDTFRSYNSLKRLGKHHRLNHGKAFAYRGKNHINGTVLRDFGVLRSIFCTIIEAIDTERKEA